MKRYYLSKIVGDGSSPENSYRPKLADENVSYVCEIKTDLVGAPVYPWALCLVSGNKHGKLIADPDNTALPDVSLDMKMSSMHTPTKAKFKADCVAHGIPSTVLDNTDGYRDAIRGIGRIHNPNFDENNFDVSE